MRTSDGLNTVMQRDNYKKSGISGSKNAVRAVSLEIGKEVLYTQDGILGNQFSEIEPEIGLLCRTSTLIRIVTKTRYTKF